MNSLELEQQFHDLESRYLTLKTEYDHCILDKNTYIAKVASLQSNLDQNVQQLTIAEHKINELTLDNSQKDKLVHDLQMSHEELNDRYKRRSDECDRLRDEIKSQAAELITFQTRLKDSQLNLNEFQSIQLPMQYELTKTIHEKDLLVQQVKYLEAELQTKVKEERLLRSDAIDKTQDLESMLKGIKYELVESNKQIIVLKEQSNDQQEKIQLYMNKLKDNESILIEKQGNFSNEIDGLKRLVELYKRYFEEATNKVEDLEKRDNYNKATNADILKSLKERILILSEESEQAVIKEREKWTLEVSKLQSQVQELQNASTQMSSLMITSQQQTLDNTIANTTRSYEEQLHSIQNFDGIGMTELYDRIVQTEKELYHERSKRREAEMYMQQILKDVESKAPVIAAQRRDYHRVVEAHTNLKSRLDILVQENNDLRKMLKGMEKKMHDAVEEAQALEVHNTDLNRQNQHLLRRTLGITQPGQRVGITSNHAIVEYNEDEANQEDPNDVVSNYLVTYDDVTELQQRNAELLRVVRKLSKEPSSYPDNESMDTTSNTSLTIQQQGQGQESLHSNALKAAIDELNAMREARQRTEEMVIVLVQQRDMYRSMIEGGAGSNTSINLSPSNNNSSNINVTTATTTTMFGTPSSVKPTSQSHPTDTQVVTSSGGVAGGNVMNAINIRELQAQLSQIEEEKKRLQDRMSRFEENEVLLNQSLDNIRKESTTAKIEGAQSKSEANFQKERAERLETIVKNLQNESMSGLQRRLELEKTLIDMQKELRLKDDKIVENYDLLRYSQDSQRKAEIEAEVAKTSEGRLIVQLSEAREETKRHVNLVEQLHRIETGLQSHAEAEKEALLYEKATLTTAYETLRKQLDDRNLLEEQKSKVAEEELRVLRTRLDQKTTEVSILNEQLVREQTMLKAAQDRSNLLERQLNIAQERIANIQGTQIIDSSIANDYTVKELALERAISEIEALKQQLSSSEVHADQFRKISAANENALREMRIKAETIQTTQESELQRMREELEASINESSEQKTSAQALLQELEDTREELRNITLESTETVRKLDESLLLSRQEVDQLKQQSIVVNNEISKYQEAANVAYKNYERELQMHAQAERELNELRKQFEDLKGVLKNEQQQCANLSAECIRKESLLQDERHKATQECEQIKEHLAGLQYTNDLLHAQVQSYGAQIEKLQDQRIQISMYTPTATSSNNINSSNMIVETSVLPDSSTTAATNEPIVSSAITTNTNDVTDMISSENIPTQNIFTNTTSTTDTGSSLQSIPPTQIPLSQVIATTTGTTAIATTTSATTTIIGSTTAANVVATIESNDELLELRKSSSEMREVLRYMKREKDMLHAKLSVADMENTRLTSELQSLRRALDEVKVELKRELDKRVPIQHPEEFNKLMVEVNQLNIVRESNSHLRSENEELSKKLQIVTNQLHIAQDAGIPLEEAVRKLKAEKESLDMVNDQLTNDVSYWRTRLHTLISRYNDVDPEEHRVIKVKLEEVTNQLHILDTTLSEKTNEILLLHESIAAKEQEIISLKDLLTIKEKENESLKITVNGSEATGAKLRETLRGFKEKFNTMVANKTQEVTIEKEKGTNLENQLLKANEDIVSLHSELASINAIRGRLEVELLNAHMTPSTQASITNTTTQMETTMITKSLSSEQFASPVLNQSDTAAIAKVVAPSSGVIVTETSSTILAPPKRNKMSEMLAKKVAESKTTEQLLQNTTIETNVTATVPSVSVTGTKRSSPGEDNIISDVTVDQAIEDQNPAIATTTSAVGRKVKKQKNTVATTASTQGQIVVGDITSTTTSAAAVLSSIVPSEMISIAPIDQHVDEVAGTTTEMEVTAPAVVVASDATTILEEEKSYDVQLMSNTEEQNTNSFSDTDTEVIVVSSESKDNDGVPSITTAIATNVTSTTANVSVAKVVPGGNPFAITSATSNDSTSSNNGGATWNLFQTKPLETTTTAAAVSSGGFGLVNSFNRPITSSIPSFNSIIPLQSIEKNDILEPLVDETSLFEEYKDNNSEEINESSLQSNIVGTNLTKPFISNTITTVPATAPATSTTIPTGTNSIFSFGNTSTTNSFGFGATTTPITNKISFGSNNNIISTIGMNTLATSPPVTIATSTNTLNPWAKPFTSTTATFAPSSTTATVENTIKSSNNSLFGSGSFLQKTNSTTTSSIVTNNTLPIPPISTSSIAIAATAAVTNPSIDNPVVMDSKQKLEARAARFAATQAANATNTTNTSAVVVANEELEEGEL